MFERVLKINLFLCPWHCPAVDDVEVSSGPRNRFCDELSSACDLLIWRPLLALQEQSLNGEAAWDIRYSMIMMVRWTT